MAAIAGLVAEATAQQEPKRKQKEARGQSGDRGNWKVTGATENGQEPPGGRWCSSQGTRIQASFRLLSPLLDGGAGFLLAALALERHTHALRALAWALAVPGLPSACDHPTDADPVDLAERDPEPYLLRPKKIDKRRTRSKR
jgi:hypothetical protein